MNINSEYLRQLHHGLVHEDDSVNDALERTHHEHVRHWKEFEKSLDEANKVSPELKEEIRRSKQASIIVKGYLTTKQGIEKASQPVIAREKKEYNTMMNASRLDAQDSIHKEQLEFARAQEIRGIMRNMTLEKRSNWLMDTTSRGDGRLLHAAEMSPDELIPESTLSLARDKYLKTAKKDIVEKYNQAKKHSEAVTNSLKVLPDAAKGLAKKYGHDLDQATRHYQADSFKETGKNLSDDGKIKLISEHGFEGYKAIRSGMMNPAEASDNE